MTGLQVLLFPGSYYLPKGPSSRDRCTLLAIIWKPREGGGGEGSRCPPQPLLSPSLLMTNNMVMMA